MTTDERRGIGKLTQDGEPRPPRVRRICADWRIQMTHRQASPLVDFNERAIPKFDPMIPVTSLGRVSCDDA